jgi:hypothetical protein
MSKATSSNTLIAKWTIKQDPSDDLPAKVYWGDGTPATINDYVVHSLGTHALIQGDDGGMECHMYLDVLANLKYDEFVNSWVASGPGIEPFSLRIRDRNATDAEITGVLYLFPVVYRAKIHR